MNNAFVTIYFDKDSAELDEGRGWTVETNDSGIIDRFSSIEDALAYARAWFDGYGEK